MLESKKKKNMAKYSFDHDITTFISASFVRYNMLNV